MKLSWRDRFSALFRGQLSVVHETDSTITIGRGFSESQRDRYAYERQDVLEDALEAWRLNPLARRIVGLTTQYVIGAGVSVICKHQATERFIRDFWTDRLNHMDVRVFELCDELTRTGNLFLLLSTDAAGMSYLRPIPATDVKQIEHRPNDVEQPLRFLVAVDAADDRWFDAYNPQDDERAEDGSYPPVVLHYTVNRPVGAQWGESDLAPVLRWLSRYSNWLEDRARLNRFRNSFLFQVKARFASEADRQARQNALAANPPQPGSILVCDETETWDVISPKLEASDANTDGLAIKKMIAAGVGVPLHFLAEPESSTRTTAEAAGGPTYRHFEQRQKYFMWILEDILSAAVARRSLVDRRIPRPSSPRSRLDRGPAVLEVRGADISARDNVSLSMAAQNIIILLADLRDRGLIDDEEYLRIAYRFAGEVVDVHEMLARGAKAAPVVSKTPAPEGNLPSGTPFPPRDARGAPEGAGGRGLGPTTKPAAGEDRVVDPETGEEKPNQER